MKYLYIALIAIIFCSCEFVDNSKAYNDNQITNQKPPIKLSKCTDYCATNSQEMFVHKEFSYLNFTNFGYRGIGRCRGHALVTQKLSHLLEFDDNNNCINSNWNSPCVNQALAAIENAMNLKASKVYGFKDLLSLSKNKRIESYLKMRVRSISHKYSARTIHINNPQSDIPSISMFYEIKDRLLDYDTPYIAIRGVGVGDHALLAYDHDFNQFGEVICVKDSNYIPRDGLKCKSFVYHQNGEVFYKRADLNPSLLFVFKLMSDENTRSISYKQQKKKYCLENAHKQKLCQL